jgi:hypothetical protein
LTPGFSVQIDKPVGNNDDKYVLQGPILNAFSPNGSKSTFQCLNQLLNCLVKSRGGRSEKERSFQLICILRLLKGNFIKYKKFQNTEETVILRVTESNSTPIKENEWIASLTKISNCKINIKEVFEENDSKNEEKREHKEEMKVETKKIETHRHTYDISIHGQDAYSVSVACSMIRDRVKSSSSSSARWNKLEQTFTHENIFCKILTTLTTLLNEYENVNVDVDVDDDGVMKKKDEKKEDDVEHRGIISLSTLVQSQLALTISKIPVASPLVDHLIEKSKENVMQKKIDNY